MAQLTEKELRDVMRACVGSDGAADLDRDDLLDTTFDDLDFDSLARVELAERLRDLHGIVMTDDDLDRLRGPRDVLDYLRTRSA